MRLCGVTALGARPKKQFARKHDVILFYARGKKWLFNKDAVSVAPRSHWAQKAGIKNIVEVDWWDIPSINNNERIGYPTQKPLALLERIIRASSNPGDVVLDPFAGCATACVAAERLGRQWIGIDVSDMAAKLVIERLQREYNAGSLPAFGAGGVFHPDLVERIAVSGRAKPARYQDRRPELYAHQSGICNGCQYAMPEHALAVDHIKPRAKGGTDELANLQLLCGGCNSMKGTGDMAALRRALADRGIL